MTRTLIAVCLLAGVCSAQDVVSSNETNKDWNIPRMLPGGDTQAWFSKKDHIDDHVVAEIDRAKKSVRVQAYSFTSSKIEAALERAKERGVDVKVILDGAWRALSPTVVLLLDRAKIPTLIDSAHAIAHNKVIIIDDAVVLTGSYNFSSAAEKRNAENMVKLTHSTVAKLYAANWDEHAKHSPVLNPDANADEEP